MKRRRLGPAAAISALLAVAATAQEPFFMDSATHPSRGLTAARALAQYFDAPEGEFGRVRLKAAHGLTPKLALAFEGGHRFGAGDGVENAALRLKWRFARFDLGPLNTVRASALAGTEIPWGGADSERDGWNPAASAVITAILGRHGFNVGAGYRRNTARARLFDEEGTFDAAYLYRLRPARYAAATRGSWYAVQELNARARGADDYELRWTPGLLYEAWRWAAEIGIVIPAARETATIERIEWGVVAGLRTLF